MAIFADKAFALLKSGELTTTFAWLGAVAYTLQIYFDFSGYSDMAIGLGQVLGFRFPENFNYPYISSSITEFWRRWHMSLSSWFRDYVYIPLGGNRCSKGRMFFNLFVVWMLTGIWHGANYTFWLWGCVYFILLMIEKTLSDRPHIHAMYKDKIIAGRLLKVFGHIYTLLTVILLWVIFRADSVLDAFRYIIYMFGRTEMSAYASGVTGLYLHSFIGYGTLAVIGCIPWKRILEKKLPYKKENKVLRVADGIWVIAVFFIACCMTLDGDYNPFIYFNF